MRKKEKDMDGAEPFAPPQPATAGAPKALSPLDIQQKEFRYARFGGYKMRDVDEFLDRVTEAMSAVVTENERLRAGGTPAPPVLGTPDLDDVGRQADEIIQRARDEAAKIVADARSRAAEAPAGVPVGPLTETQRAAINAFLTREKEFLQNLAGLVQDHAGSVKEMAKEARSRGVAATAPARPEAQTPILSAGAPVKKVSPAPAPPPPTSAPTPASPTAAPSDEASADKTISLPQADAPVRMEEPATASARRDGGDDEARESGDSSLRELFWGEE